MRGFIINKSIFCLSFYYEKGNCFYFSYLSIESEFYSSLIWPDVWQREIIFPEDKKSFINGESDRSRVILLLMRKYCTMWEETVHLRKTRVCIIHTRTSADPHLHVMSRGSIELPRIYIYICVRASIRSSRGILESVCRYNAAGITLVYVELHTTVRAYVINPAWDCTDAPH